MKLSCLPVSYFDDIVDGRMSIAQWGAEAASLGLDGIDLSIIFFRNGTEGDLRKTRSDIESQGQRVAVMNTYPDLTHLDSHERERQLTKLKQDIVIASYIGAEMVRVTVGQAHPQTSRERGILQSASGCPVSMPE